MLQISNLAVLLYLVFPALFISGKCQVLTLMVGRSRDQVLQRAYCRVCMRTAISVAFSSKCLNDIVDVQNNIVLPFTYLSYLPIHTCTCREVD